MELKRFGVSIPRDLLEQFDDVVTRKGNGGRSEAIRDAMRLYISKHQWNMEGAEGFASLNIVYEHKPRLTAALLKSQHESEAEVLSTLHTHITRTHCFETLTIKGSVAELVAINVFESSFAIIIQVNEPLSEKVILAKYKLTLNSIGTVSTCT